MPSADGLWHTLTSSSPRFVASADTPTVLGLSFNSDLFSSGEGLSLDSVKKKRVRKMNKHKRRKRRKRDRMKNK